MAIKHKASAAEWGGPSNSIPYPNRFKTNISDITHPYIIRRGHMEEIYRIKMVSKNCKQLQLITSLIKCTTHIKTQKLSQASKQVANKSVFQFVFALLVYSLWQQIWNKLLTRCNELDSIARLVENLVTNLIISTSLLQVVRNSFQTC